MPQCLRRIHWATVAGSTASGSSSSGRSSSPSGSSGSPRATATADRSARSSVLVIRAARQSGNRLKVRCAVGQYQRAIQHTSGIFRKYVPCRANPHPPSGCSEQRSKLAAFYPSCAAYSSRVNSIANRSCTLRGPSRYQRRRAFFLSGMTAETFSVVTQASLHALDPAKFGDGHFLRTHARPPAIPIRRHAPSLHFGATGNETTSATSTFQHELRSCGPTTFQHELRSCGPTWCSSR